MSKLDELRRMTAGNIDDSMGVGRAARPADAPPSPSSPARWQGVVKSKAAAEIPTNRIGPDPDQPRETFEPDALDRLAESMKSRGQLQPIRVRWDEGRGSYVIICGERRWRAAQRAGLPMMTAIVTDAPLDAGELLSIQLIENALREDLNDMEQARAFRALMDRNDWSAREVGRQLGYPQGTLAKLLKMFELPAEVQDRVERGELPVTTAYEIARLADPAEQAEIAGLAVAEGMNRDEVVKAVRERSNRAAKGRGAKPKPRKTSATIRTAGGFKITVEHRRGLDDDTLLVAARELVALLESKAGARGEAA